MHRSYIVNLNCIKEILRVDGSYVVVAADRDETHIPVARRQVKQFREAGRASSARLARPRRSRAARALVPQASAAAPGRVRRGATKPGPRPLR